jgi:carboxymethylenebutenolidase
MPETKRELSPMGTEPTNVDPTTATVEESVALGRHHRPQRGVSFPGLVLIHDVWGLTEHSQQLAAGLASEGFAVLEIDLYRQGVGPPTEDPGGFIRSLSDPSILADLELGAEWLMNQPTGHDRKVGVVGVCMGGTFALLAAATSNRFSAAAPFYGILSYETGMLAEPAGRDREKKPCSPIEIADRTKIPLLASFGLEDEFVPNDDVDRLEAALARSGQRFEIDRYEGAGHAFLNRTREPAYRAEASQAAWARVIPFLRGELD